MPLNIFEVFYEFFHEPSLENSREVILVHIGCSEEDEAKGWKESKSVHEFSIKLYIS